MYSLQIQIAPLHEVSDKNQTNSIDNQIKIIRANMSKSESVYIFFNNEMKNINYGIVVL